MFRASLLLTLISSLTLGCQDSTPLNAANANTPKGSLTPPDTSLYWLDDEWVDQEGAAFTLGQMRGQLVITAMIFTHCKYACPRIVEDLKRIADDLPLAARSRVHFLLVTMDTERDTPEVLKDFAEEHQLSAADWTLLHGDAMAVRGFAATLGVNYQRASNGDFSHSNLISLLDTNGCLVQQLSGLGADSTPLMTTINSLVPTL